MSQKSFFLLKGYQAGVGPVSDIGSYQRDRMQRRQALNQRLGQRINTRTAKVQIFDFEAYKAACIARANRQIESGLNGLQCKINEVIYG